MNKNLGIGLAVAAVIAIAIAAFVSNKNKASNTDTTTSTTTTQTTSSAADTSNAAAPKLEIVDSKVGSGAEAVSGKTITVHYTGTLTNGTKFDSSLDRKEPFTFSLGAGQVIKGWDQGFAGMKVGGKRKLTIPPELAYGPNAVGSIPANSTLVFEVELLDVK